MAKHSDKLKLHKELQKFNADSLTYRMAAILLSIHGINNAMRFAERVKPKKGEQLTINY